MSNQSFSQVVDTVVTSQNVQNALNANSIGSFKEVLVSFSEADLIAAGAGNIAHGVELPQGSLVLNITAHVTKSIVSAGGNFQFVLNDAIDQTYGGEPVTDVVPESDFVTATPNIFIPAISHDSLHRFFGVGLGPAVTAGSFDVVVRYV